MYTAFLLFPENKQDTLHRTNNIILQEVPVPTLVQAMHCCYPALIHFFGCQVLIRMKYLGV